MASLVEQSQTTVGGPHVLGIHVKEEIGAEGWTAIWRAVEYLGRFRCTLVSERAATVSGRKKDMMAIWEVIGNWSVKHNGRYGEFTTWALQVKGWS